MVNQKISHRPTICYRPIQPSDLEVLERLHADIFPIRYEEEFFQSVVHARDIVSWAAVDRSRPNGHSDELIGFVTARIVLAKETEIGDLLIYDPLKPDQTLVYIMTLGVVETYRNLGIARSLIRQVIKYASSIPTCHAVYLHVISYNIPAIHLYKKMSFKCIRRLQGFYLINGQHYDSFLFVYYVNGGCSPCSPLELLVAAVSYMTSSLKTVAARLRKNEEESPKLPKCKETKNLWRLSTEPTEGFYYLTRSVMATLSSSADQTSDLLQKLSLDSQTKTLEMPEPTSKIQPSDRSVTPVLSNFMDPTVCYLPNGYQSYYYGGYNGAGEWDDYSKYLNPEGVDMVSGVYGDNGSAMYPHGYWYGPYSPYSPAASPVPTMGNDGQLYGPQHYQYPPPYFQPLTPSGEPFTPSHVAPSQGDLSISTATDQKPLPVETAKENSNGIANGVDVKGSNGAVPYKPKYQNSYGRGGFTKGLPASGYKDLKSRFDRLQPDSPLLDTSVLSSGLYKNTEISSSFSKAGNAPSSRNQNFHQNSHFMGWQHPALAPGVGSTHGYMNRMYPNKFYGQYGNGFKSGMGFGSGGYNAGINGHGWLAIDSKYKPKGRGNGYFGYHNDSIDGLNELNRGPRAKGYFKNQKGFVPATVAVKGQSVPSSDTNVEEKDKTTVVPDREQYNKADFPEEYDNAKFFIIKSYSEDDVHKCIKYNVWASTPNGNKKLDAAYQEAEQKSGGCPVFLLFSVNTSGQFVGLAEMTGRVDFDKSVEYWQQDKWTGYFPVKWHIVKDVPNSFLKHITLENNENKPVTNSRDTQEVKLEQGLKLIKIFKDHSSKTCILDDFVFYEDREKMIQEKKAKQQQLKKQVWDGKPCEEKKEIANGS